MKAHISTFFFSSSDKTNYIRNMLPFFDMYSSFKDIESKQISNDNVHTLLRMKRIS